MVLGLARWSRLLGETLLIAYVATLTVLSGRLLARLRRAAPDAPSIGAFRGAAVLEFCRTVPDIVFALIFVAAFGSVPCRRLGTGDPHDRRARQAVHRGGGKYRHGPG